MTTEKADSRVLRRGRLLALMAALSLPAARSHAGTVTWVGANTTGSTLSQYRLDDAVNWGGALPGAGDVAVIAIGTTSPSEIILPSTTTPAFAPGSISISHGSIRSPGVYLYDDVSTASVKISTGGTSAGMGDNVLRIGPADASAAGDARLTNNAAGTVNATSVDITGSLGTATIDFSSVQSVGNNTDATGQNLRRDAAINLINAQTVTTGVAAVAAGNNTFQLFSATAGGASATGEDKFVRVAVNAGTFTTVDRINTSAGSRQAFGSAATGVTLDLTGADPIDFSTGATTSWKSIRLGAGSTLQFSGSTVNLNTPNQTASSNLGVGQLAGAGGGRVVFSAVGGTVNLKTPLAHPDGNINVGFHQLAVRSDQTWNFDASPGTDNISFVKIGHRYSASGAGPWLIESIDGGRLDNLDNVNIYINVFSPTESSTATTGMRIYGGTYGSLHFTGGTTTIREKHLVLADDVSFVGRAVKLGNYTGNVTTNVSASVTDYGVILDTASTMIKILATNNYDLSITYGLLMTDSSAAQTSVSSASRVQARLDAAGSTLTVGGDIVVSSTNNRPDSAAATQGRTSRSMGITGDATTVVNLGGNWIHQMRSRGTAALSLSTVNLVGGASVRTFEVGDAATLNTLSANSFGMRNLNVGNGATAGNVKLVNDYLNDNPIDFANVTGNERNGEKFIVGKLAIAANSKLDVNGKPVLITTHDDPLVTAFLAIDGTGTLDLNTGLSLDLGMIVPTFVGIGDQTAAWNLSAARVIDSDNPWVGFGATVSDGNTVWEVVSVPEPGSLGFLGLAGVVLLRRRRQ